MASKTLFQSIVGTLLPKSNTVNDAGGSAYAFSHKQALAQYAATGCLNSTRDGGRDSERAARGRESVRVPGRVGFDAVAGDRSSQGFGGSATETMKQWASFQSRNPQARLVCIDIQPNGTTQAAEREDITNIGGFSDQVFSLIADSCRWTCRSSRLPSGRCDER